MIDPLRGGLPRLNSSFGTTASTGPSLYAAMRVLKAFGITSSAPYPPSTMSRTTTNLAIGIDIAKDTLELAVRAGEATEGHYLEQTTLPNTAQGHAQLITLVHGYEQAHGRAHLVMEATGSYHVRLLKALLEAGLPTSVINPLQLKRFAQMKLRRTKTDRSDAQLLAQYAQEQRPPLYQVQPVVQQQLRQIGTVIRQLTKQRTGLKNLQHAQAQLPEAVALCDRVLAQQVAHLDQALARLEQRQGQLVEQAYRRQRRVLESIPGLGGRTAIALLALLGDMSRFSSHRQVVAYLGLNPVARDSGSSLRARRHISKQGHAGLRTLLYLCALSASRHNRVCRDLYERLLARGRAKKVALIAVANKLVKQAFTVVKKDELFDNAYLEKRALLT